MSKEQQTTVEEQQTEEQKQYFVKVQLDVPFEVHNAYKMEKLKKHDKRSLNKVYVEVITNNLKGNE